MSSLTRLERSYYAVGSRSTKPGIFDYLFEHRPCYARGSAGMCAALKREIPSILITREIITKDCFKMSAQEETVLGL
jgi:hypothetical protein